tara:strand:- start:147 stop:1355 length:1209 start_codon:yes stop_codon:yes gene_type:complete
MEKNVSIERANELANETLLESKYEIIPLEVAHGRILHSSLTSNVNDPIFDNSSMDGWAVKESDCISLPCKLSIIGTIQAGKESNFVVEKGSACRIMTGAPMPKGANAIVMIEDSIIENNMVVINGPARQNYIRKKGENIVKDEIGLKKGVLLQPSQLAMAALMGYSVIPVTIPPVIGIIGTGDELVKPGDELKPGQIYETNSTALAGLITNIGCVPKKYPFVSDDLSSLREIFDVASSECDVIITSGGVSMGEWDLVRRLMEEEGLIKFWRVLIKPGGPPLFGTWKETPLFGLPGNPVSSQISFMKLVFPWISKSLSFDNQNGPKLFDRVRVKLLSDAKGTPNKITYRRVIIQLNGNELTGIVPLNQGSGNLRSMVECNGLIELKKGANGKSGDFIDALWFR